MDRPPFALTEIRLLFLVTVRPLKVSDLPGTIPRTFSFAASFLPATQIIPKFEETAMRL